SLSMLTLVVALFFQSNNWERQRLESVFHSQARTVAENLKHDIDRYQDAVAEVRRLYESSTQVTLREFQHFTAELLERSPGIRALEFVPLVHDADRLSFERRAQAEGLSGFSIREFHKDGTVGPAHQRPEYYPVYQLAPLEGNEMALGLDMGSDPSRRTAVEQARTTRRSTATPGIVIVNTRQLGVLLFSPVFVTPGSNNDVFRGVAMAALDLKNVVELGVPDAVANDVLINLIDVTTPDSPQPLYTDSREPPRETLMEWRIPLRFANRDWQLHLQASTAFLNEQRSLISWLVLAGGLLLTGILQILLLMMASHTRSVEARVRERTRALVHSEERFRAVFNDNPDAILVVDSRGHIVGSNARAVSLFGYDRATLEQASIELLMPERWRQIHEQHRKGFFTAPQVRAMGAGLALFGRRSDGKEFPVDVMISPMHLGDETLAIAIVRDITERKRLEQEREESEARFRAVAESASDALISSDAQGYIVFANPAAEKMFGYPQDQLLGLPLSQLMPVHQELENADGPHEAHALAAARTGKRHDGGEFPVEVSEATWSFGGARYSTTIIRDITQRRAQEERLNSTLREKDMLLKEVYHRVKNNLQVIQSLLNLESRSLSDEPARQALADMGTRIRAMALVHEKLYQSRNLASISLSDYIHDLLHQLQNSGAIDSSRIRVQVNVSNIDVGLESAIPLGLLLNELVSNAF
ncbi:MAG TPA: PAS domain S-box protein, partial [Candidatus Kapabacteria bacterium]|nr:PAS domain S-box protein [Candidatus Kapabacteria bacterium]